MVLWYIKHRWFFLMPSPVFTYILNIGFGNTFFLIHTVKWSNSSISYNLISHKSTKLDIFKYCYVSLTIQLRINHVSIQLNDQTAIFQIIQFSMSNLFALSLNVKQFYLKNRLNPIRCYHSRSESSRER